VGDPRILEPHVARLIVVSPTDTGIRQARAKTDRLDARTLAKLLWAGELDGVWTPDERVRVMRRRLARRAQLVRARSRVKNEIHAVLMRCLKDRPPASDLLGIKAGGGWPTSSSRSASARPSTAACARSTSSTPRSRRSTV
jgi:transposase